MSLHPSANIAGPCPSSTEWQHALWGRTTSERWVQIESHLMQCSKCEATVDALTEESDTVVRNLCQGPATGVDEPVYQTLYETLLSSSEMSGHRYAEPVIPSLPHQLGNYELLAPLGHGANGSVYQARHLALDRFVAIKLLRPDLDFDPTSVDRFIQEMRAVGSLDHPHIVRATDAGETDGQHYLVMEYVPGIDLSSVIAQHGVLRPSDACEVLRQAAVGLSYLHDHGFVHRDVKPSNLLLTAEGQIKLLDLGLVQSVKQQPKNEPPQGQLPHGTADYMAPEQWRAFGHVEFRSDLYSLGCTLAKLLTGAPPYRPLPAGFVTKFAAHCEAPAPVLRSLRSDVSDAIQETLATLLAKQPEQRFASAHDLAKHLRPLARGSDLRGLALACGQEPSEQRAVVADAGWTGRRWTRRQALTAAGLVAAGALAGTPLLRKLLHPNATESFVRTNRWRALVPASPAVLVPEGVVGQPRADGVPLWEPRGDAGLVIRSPKLLLLNLGQPVVGKFRFAIDLVTPMAHSNAGLFFRYARQQHGDQRVHRFHTIELVRNVKSGVEKYRLVWSALKVVQREGKIKADRTLLAETDVPHPDDLQPHSLEVRLGGRGFPEVFWDDLAREDWRASDEGKQQAALFVSQEESEFHGYVGLIAGEPDSGVGHEALDSVARRTVDGSSQDDRREQFTEFRRPRLSYEAASSRT